MSADGKVILVTGASRGIGRAQASAGEVKLRQAGLFGLRLGFALVNLELTRATLA